MDWRDTMMELMPDALAADPGRAKRLYDINLARAQWMTHTGYRLLLRERG
jgi:hypothetical protein